MLEKNHMKKKPSPGNSDRNICFWLMALWPLICLAIVAIGFLAAGMVKTL
jgi:hypothetical protein